MTKPLHIPGWTSGWNDEIGNSAAVTDRPKKAGRRRILVMTQDDREPRYHEESVELGLYELSDDGDWELLFHDDFDTVKKALDAVKKQPELWS